MDAIPQIPLPKCAYWIVRTDHDESDGSCAETVVSAITCKAEEFPGVNGPLTVVTADHVTIVIPGTLWEIEQLAAEVVS